MEGGGNVFSSTIHKRVKVNQIDKREIYTENKGIQHLLLFICHFRTRHHLYIITCLSNIQIVGIRLMIFLVSWLIFTLDMA